MALNARDARRLGQVVGGLASGTSSLDQLNMWFTNAMNNGATTDDLKPYLDQLSQSGVSVDLSDSTNIKFSAPTDKNGNLVLNQSPGAGATGGAGGGGGQTTAIGKIIMNPAGTPDKVPNDIVTGPGASDIGMVGGVPVLTNIMLGMSVDEAMAGLFGQDATTWDKFYAAQTPQMQQSINVLRGHLNTVQSNFNLRQSALTELTNNYPEIVAKSLNDLSTTLGPSIDSISQNFMKQTADNLAAQYQTRGGFSSGGFNEGVAKTATELAASKQSYLEGQAGKIYDQRYSEASASLNFQKMMLGQADQNIFNADQSKLDRQANIDLTNKKLQMTQDQIDANRQDQLFGSIGNLAGTVAGGYLASLDNSSSGGGGTNMGPSLNVPGYPPQFNPGPYG